MCRLPVLAGSRHHLQLSRHATRNTESLFPAAPRPVSCAPAKQKRLWILLPTTIPAGLCQGLEGSVVQGSRRQARQRARRALSSRAAPSRSCTDSRCRTKQSPLPVGRRNAPCARPGTKGGSEHSCPLERPALPTWQRTRECLPAAKAMGRRMARSTTATAPRRSHFAYMLLLMPLSSCALQGESNGLLATIGSPACIPTRQYPPARVPGDQRSHSGLACTPFSQSAKGHPHYNHWRLPDAGPLHDCPPPASTSGLILPFRYSC